MQSYNQEFLSEIKEMYSDYFDVEYIAKNFSIPEEYLKSIGLIDVDELYSHYAITLNTKRGLDLYGDDFFKRKQKGTLHENDVMFICIGEWSDKHEFQLCCDTSSSAYGKVFDFNDAHPWFGTSEGEMEWDSFKEFLKDEFNVELTQQ